MREFSDIYELFSGSKMSDKNWKKKQMINIQMC